MQFVILPSPPQESDILKTFRALGVIIHEDKYRILLGLNDDISLEKLKRKWPEFRKLMSKIKQD